MTPVERLEVRAYRIPTEAPESDGTLEWSSTTLVVVDVFAAEQRGLGYTYADPATAALIHRTLAEHVRGLDAFAINAAWDRMLRAVRNLGGSGIAAMAISAVDCALWDLKAKLLGVSLANLLGPARESVPAYGSGGFTSLSTDGLMAQLGQWARAGFRFVKLKVGRAPEDDVARVRAAREAVGQRCQLFVDANGGYRRKQALRLAEDFAAQGVRWFEEPVSSDDREGLRLIRDRAPAEMDIAAGEYGYTLGDFEALLSAGAVDVLQADVTRCMGITGLLRVAALARAHQIPLSTHCAPALHLHPACALSNLLHLEAFFDHLRIERMLFDGVREPAAGDFSPDWSRPGHGLSLRTKDAEKFLI